MDVKPFVAGYSIVFDSGDLNRAISHGWEEVELEDKRVVRAYFQDGLNQAVFLEDEGMVEIYLGMKHIELLRRREGRLYLKDRGSERGVYLYGPSFFKG